MKLQIDSDEVRFDEEIESKILPIAVAATAAKEVRRRAIEKEGLDYEVDDDIVAADKEIAPSQKISLLFSIAHRRPFLRVRMPCYHDAEIISHSLGCLVTTQNSSLNMLQDDH